MISIIYINYEVISGYFLSIPISCLVDRLKRYLHEDDSNVDHLLRSVNASTIAYATGVYPSRAEICKHVIDEQLRTLSVYCVSSSPLTRSEVLASLERNVVYAGILTMKTEYNTYVISRCSWVCIKVPVGLMSIQTFSDIPICYASRLPVYKSPSMSRVPLVSLRDYQVDNYTTVFNGISDRLKLNLPSSVNLGFPCGYGKTWLTMALVCSLGLKTLICCPTIIIARQWHGVFSTNTIHGLNVVISDKGVSKLLETLQLEDIDVLIIIDKHFLSSEFCRIARQFSFFVFDESHSYKLTSPTGISKRLYDIVFPVSVYLSGTPRAENIHITGPNYGNYEYTCNGQIHTLRNTYPLTVTDKKNIRDKIRPYTDKLTEYNVYINVIDKLESRNSFIADSLSSIIKDSTRMLILCELIVQTQMIYDKIVDKYDNVAIIKSGYYGINELNAFKLQNHESYIMISTIDLCSKGLDVKGLNTLYIANTGIENLSIRQAAGRILRDKSPDPREIYFVEQKCGNILDKFSSDRISIGKSHLINEGWFDSEKMNY